MYTYLLDVSEGVWLVYLLEISIPRVFTVKNLASDWTFVTKWSFEAKKKISNGPTFRKWEDCAELHKPVVLAML